MLSVHNRRVALRDLTRADIDTLLAWEAKEITLGDYRLWDAPWEYEGLSVEERREALADWGKRLNDRMERAETLDEGEPRSWLVIAPREDENACIGWCSSYYIDDNCSYSAEPTDRTAVGINIIDPAVRGSGFGFAALKLFIDYLTITGTERIFAQTWSGNHGMISLAEKLGFKEMMRKQGVRTVRGGTYDGLTFELDRGAFAALIEPAEELPLKKLDELGISCTRLTHPAASTMELCRGIGEEQGAAHCKNLFLANRSRTSFWLLMIDPDKPYRTSEVSKKLGVSRLSFGSGEKLAEVLGLEPGCVSVMGLVNECAKRAYAEGRLRLAIDRDLLNKENICVHPNVSTATLVISTQELKRFLNELGVGYVTVEV